jgi:predicted DNA-binding transcriptional regulator AlpA
MSRPIPPVTTNTVYLTSTQVRERLGGRSRAWLPRAVKAGRFPMPYRLGDGWLLYWKLSEIEEWEVAHVACAVPKPRQRNAA